MYYSSIGILALVLHIIVNYDVLIRDDYREVLPANKPYRHFLISLIVFFSADIMWGFIYDATVKNPDLLPLIYINTVVFFASMVVSVLMWTRYIVAYLGANNAFSRILTYAGWLILVYEIVNLVINTYIPIVFKFNDDGTYEPGSARYITLAIQVVLFFSASLYSLIVAFNSEDRNRHHHRAVGLSGIAMTIFIILQTTDPFMPLYAVGCLLGTCLLHTFVLDDEKAEHKKELEELLMREMKQREELESTRQMAYADSLTGVKNKHAYVEAEDALDNRIAEGDLNRFGIAVFDLNGLKIINDTLGHDEGDNYIRAACRLICKTFKHSPVFRIGGDEFVAFLEGEDYENRDALMEEFDLKVENNLREGKVVVSSGCDIFRKDQDNSFQSIFGRADKQMYERKKFLKEMSAGKDSASE